MVDLTWSENGYFSYYLASISVKFAIFTRCWSVRAISLYGLFRRSLALVSDSSLLLIPSQLSFYLLALVLVAVLGFSLIVAIPFWYFLVGLMLIVVTPLFFLTSRFSFISWNFCRMSELNLLMVSARLVIILFAKLPKC